MLENVVQKVNDHISVLTWTTFQMLSDMGVNWDPETWFGGANKALSVVTSHPLQRYWHEVPTAQQLSSDNEQTHEDGG